MEHCPLCVLLHPGGRPRLQSQRTHPLSEWSCPACVLCGGEGSEGRIGGELTGVKEGNRKKGGKEREGEKEGEMGC